MFKITNLKELDKSKKERDLEIQKIKNEYNIALSTGQSDLTKDILNLIEKKLKKLIEQKQQPEIIKLETQKKETMKTFAKSYEKSMNEIEDILALLTSGLSQKKRVEKITKTKIKGVEGVENKYIAYLENGVQYEITSETHTSLSERYLELVETKNGIEKEKREYLEKFNKEIKEKCKDYVEFDFFELLQELNNISKKEYLSIYDFHKNTYIDFYGNEKDFKTYKIIINNIIDKLETLEKLDKGEQ